VIDAALAILTRRVSEPGGVIDSPGAARELVRLHLAQCERERFGVLFLNGQHAVIGFEVLFKGTLTQTSVHPREVVRRALQLNAAAVILAHNHPSGNPAPSKADQCLTDSLRYALTTVDVRVLDHLVIGWPGVASMAELGML
jgi:DNA repair protein RadC